MSKSFIYTVEEHSSAGIKKQTYEGFRRWTGDTNATLGIVWFDGSAEVYEVSGDKTLAVSEIQRLYRASYNQEVRVHLFKSL